MSTLGKTWRNPPREQTFKIRAIILEMHAQGKTQREMAAQLGITPQSAHYHTKMMGLKFHAVVPR